MIVDRDDYTASAALVTSLTLSNDRTAAETIARWVNEVQTVLTTRMDMVQFHALALLRKYVRTPRAQPAPVASCVLLHMRIHSRWWWWW